MKIKASAKNGQNIVRLKLDAGYTVNAREYEMLSTKNLRGLMKVVSAKQRQFEYVGPLGVALPERLKMPISANGLFFIIAQITEMAKDMKKNGLAMCNLVLDPNYVYINGATKQLWFLYMPIVVSTFYIDLRQFIDTVISMTRLDTRDASVTVSSFSKFLEEMPYFDADKVSGYIDKVSPSTMAQVKKLTLGNSGFLTDDRREQYRHYNDRPQPQSTYSAQSGPRYPGSDAYQTVYTPQNNRPQPQSVGSAYQSTGYAGRQPGNNDYDATGLLNDDYSQTGVLDDSYDTSLLTPAQNGQVEEMETTFLDNSDTYSRNGRAPAVKYMKLTRVSTGETVEINKPVFRVGKEREYVDYFIANNNAISRSHADIINKGGRYFIVDKNSKNRTFVNDEPIPVGVEVEINKNSRIRLANEDFTLTD